MAGINGKPFLGPFYGLNTTQPRRSLDQRYAADARNVLLSTGSICPRPPLEPLSRAAMPAPLEIVSLFHWNPPAWNRDTTILVKAVTSRGGELWSFSVRGAVNLATGLSDRAPTWVPVHGLVYVIDGSKPLLKTDGTPEGTLPVGLSPMPYDKITVGTFAVPAENEAGLPVGRLRWALTTYDANHDVESNPTYYPSGVGVIAIEEGEDPQGRQFSWSDDAISTIFGAGVTHVRLYRKNVSLKDTGYWLVDQVEINPFRRWILDPRYNENLAKYTNVTLGSRVTGPWAPVKNEEPTFRPTIGAYYKDRMYYSTAGASRLRFSGIGHPDHSDPLDLLPLTGDEEDGITGMAELSGQLVILKRRSIWVLAGQVETHTNETIATAADPPVSRHEVYRTKAKIGCANTRGGNGAIVAGHPPLLFFNSETGLYAFDGIDERQLTDLIRPTWKEFVRRGTYGERNQAISYALDPLQELLYVCHDGDRTGRSPHMLVYHYGRSRGDGIGVWTDFDLAPFPYQARCVASALGHPFDVDEDLEPIFYSPILIGTDSRMILVLNDRLVAGPNAGIPPHHYQTGDLPVMEGRLGHVYDVTWLHGRATAHTPARTLGFGYAVNGASVVAGQTPETIVRDVSRSIATRQPVSREITDLSLAVVGNNQDPNVIWDRSLAVVGWQVRAEPAGEGV